MIYTGYFAKTKKYEGAGLQPVSIAGKSPEFFKGPKYPSLAPEYKMFMDWKKGNIDNMEYTHIFKKHLDTLDKEAVRRFILGFDKPVILLCYEKPKDFCHRHIVADWIENNLDIRVDEYDQDVINKELQATEGLKEYWFSLDDLHAEYNIDPIPFIERLKKEPPEGYFLNSSNSANDETTEYTLQNSVEFLKDYGIR